MGSTVAAVCPGIVGEVETPRGQGGPSMRSSQPVNLARLADRELLVPAPAGVGTLAAHLVDACQLSGLVPRRHEVQLMQTAIALVGVWVGVGIAGGIS